MAGCYISLSNLLDLIYRFFFLKSILIFVIDMQRIVKREKERIIFRGVYHHIKN